MANVGINLRLTPEEHALVVEHREATGVPTLEFIRRLIRKELGGPKPKPRTRRKAGKPAA